MPQRPTLERQLTATSTTTTVSGVGERRQAMNSRQPSLGGSSTLDALGLRRSAASVNLRNNKQSAF